MSLKLGQAVAADRRLRILSILNSEVVCGKCNEILIAELVDLKYGHKVSNDVLRIDLMWLHEALLCEVSIQRVWIAQISLRGKDVAEGKAFVPGVLKARADD